MSVSEQSITHLALADWLEEFGPNDSYIWRTHRVRIQKWLRDKCPDKAATHWAIVVEYGEKSLVKALLIEFKDDYVCRQFGYPAYYRRFGERVGV